MGVLTISYCCNWCKPVPKDDIVCFYEEDGAHRNNTAKRMVGPCPNCQKKDENDGYERSHHASP